MKATIPKVSQDACDLLFSPFADWDTVEYLGMKIGERLPNGSYDGQIGAVASGKADMIIQLVNPAMFDSSHDIPGTFGPIAYDGTLAILSVGQPGDQISSSLLDFFSTNVDGEFYFYTLVWTLIFIVTRTIIVITLWDANKRNANKRDANKVGAKPKVSIEADEESIHNESEVSTIKAIIKTVINCIWLISEIFLLTESKSEPSVKIRKTFSLAIMTFSLVICVYYALDLVMWNLLSAELTIETPSRFVDSITDLINGTGRGMKPVILTDFGALSYLGFSTNEDESELYRYIKRWNESENQIGFNSAEGVKSLSDTGKLFTDVTTGTTAFIERVFSFGFIPILCYHKPEIMKSLHTSRQTFGGGYFTFFYGPHMAPPAVNDLYFHQTNLIEMGFFLKGILQNLKLEIYEKSEVFPDPIKGMICENEIIERVGNDPRYSPPEELHAFDLKVLSQVFSLYIIGMVSSFFALGLELVFHRYENILHDKLRTSYDRIMKINYVKIFEISLRSLERARKRLRKTKVEPKDTDKRSKSSF